MQESPGEYLTKDEKRNLPMSEPVPIADTFCLALARIERVGPCARLVFTSEQVVAGTNECERPIVAKLVLPMAELPRIAELLCKNGRPHAACN